MIISLLSEGKTPEPLSLPKRVSAQEQTDGKSIEIDDSATSVSQESVLLEVKNVSITGDIYRIVLGKQTLLTKTTLEKPSVKDNTVLIAKEYISGESEPKYTVKEIYLSDATTNSEADFEIKAQGFLNYALEGFIVNYSVIPTLTNGPVLMKSYNQPNVMYTIDSHLSDILVHKIDGNKESANVSKGIIPNIPYSTMGSIKTNILNKKETSISL